MSPRRPDRSSTARCILAGCGLGATLALVALPGRTLAQQPPRPAQAAVPARLWVAGRPGAAILTGRDAENLILGPSAAPDALTGRLPVAQIERVRFTLEFNGFHLARAIHERNWNQAVQILNPAIAPVLPYLDLPHNNAADLALELGTHMMRAAHRLQRDGDPDSARRGFEAAYNVFRHCSTVEWSPVGALGRLKGSQALLATGRANTAREQVARMTQPVPGDAAYGHYWLVSAQLAEEAGDWREAIEAAVRSVCFENKDIETFPDALMLSARAYAALLEWHRARDVYYEVASIFPNTDFADQAVEALRQIVAGGYTEDAETVAAERTFFGLTEDMNAQVTDLLRRLDAGETPTLRPPDEERAAAEDRGLPDLETEPQP